jgi:16S rRNA (guanine966-N2)-methyltransferase
VGLLRIVAGELKGRRLRVPDAPGLRPTSDRVRQALFDILGQRLPGGRVLDAYAGSGALGFEALSRGAAEAVFVESGREAAAAIRENARGLGVEDRCRLVQGDAVTLLEGRRLQGPFAWVFADPPWVLGAGTAFLPALERSGVVAGGSTVVVERDARSDRSHPPETGPGSAPPSTGERPSTFTCLEFRIVGPIFAGDLQSRSPGFPWVFDRGPGNGATGIGAADE